MPLFADNIRNLHASLIVMALVIAGLVLGKDILIPLALATLIAFMLAPVVRLLASWRVPEGGADGVVLAVVLGAVVAMSVVLSAQLLSLAEEFPKYRPNLVEKVRMLKAIGSGEGAIKRAADSVESLTAAVSRELADAPAARPAGHPGAVSRTEQPKGADFGAPAGSSTAPSGDPKAPAAAKDGPSAADGLKTVVEPLAKMALTLLFTLFLLLQHQDLRDRVVRVAGTDNLSGTTAAMSDAGERLSQLFLAQAMLNAGFGLFVGLALAVIGVPNPVLWGVVAAIMRFVPYIGSFVAAVPPILLAAGVDPGWSMVVMTVLLFVVGEPVMGHVVEPLLLGKSAGLSPFALVVSASFWTLIWGPIGLVLAAPLTLLLVVLGRYVSGLEFVSVLLGDERALSREQELYGRVLAGDSAAAIAQASEAAEETSVVGASDDILLPALRLAAADRRRGRLDDPRVAAIGQTMREVVSFLAETIPEPKGGDRPSRPTAAEGRRTRIHVLPARGLLDAAAAEVVAMALGTLSGAEVEHTRSTGGLSALAELRAASNDRGPEVVVIATVGGLEARQLRLITRRAQHDFPNARILVLSADGDCATHAGVTDRRMGAAPSGLDADGATEAAPQCVGRLADLLGILSYGPRGDTRSATAAEKAAEPGVARSRPADVQSAAE